MTSFKVDHDKLGTYIAAGSMILTVLAAVAYIAAFLSRIDTKMDFLERIKAIEVRLEEKK